MDRTKASDAFNAGSIPVGCILHHPEFFMPVWAAYPVLRGTVRGVKLVGILSGKEVIYAER